MESAPKSRSRRAEVRKNRPDASRFDWQHLQAAGIPASVGIAAAFFLVASGILLLRQDVVPYRPDQPITHDIVARVGFHYHDHGRYADAQNRAAQREPRVYLPNPDGSPWDALEKELLALPERVTAAAGDLPPNLRDVLDPGAVTALRLAASSKDAAAAYARSVAQYVQSLRDGNRATKLPLVVLRDEERREDVRARKDVRLADDRLPAGRDTIDAAKTYALGDQAELRAVLQPLAAEAFALALQPKVVDLTLARLAPTHVYDDAATVARRNAAAAAVRPEAGVRAFQPNDILVRRSSLKIGDDDWNLLRAENAHYVASLEGAAWKPKLGTACLTLIVTVVLAAYVACFQPRIVKNHMRAAAIAGLLLSMLLLAALAGVRSAPIYWAGIAPTVLVGMILSIAYDRRFGIGVASMHGLLATVALNEGVTFFLVMWVGVLTVGFMLGDLRNRSRLIEVGGAAALTMMAAAAAAGLLDLEGRTFIVKNALYAGAAGLSVGFVVLGILPFIERAFRITTSMTLLELADVSQPLLRRLAVEAPGTYSHSLQVATLAEAAAEAIGANALLCRVGAYYHDVGKIHKADYFVENQTGGESRHLNLTPSVSYYIIASHVKDGVELAREYNLPTSLVPFIQQHHGTTLVEYFYRQACARQSQCDPPAPVPADHEYRYPGPKPRSREVGVLMIADAVESATRAMNEPTAPRVEQLVRDLILKRLLDGQFDECDLTMRDLDKIQRTMVKTLMSIYHGRISYPSTSGLTDAGTSGAPSQQPALTPVKTA